jgi:hypothetical protein
VSLRHQKLARCASVATIQPVRNRSKAGFSIKLTLPDDAEGNPASESLLDGVCLDNSEQNAFLARITAVKGADEGDRAMQALRKLQAMLST